MEMTCSSSTPTDACQSLVIWTDRQNASSSRMAHPLPTSPSPRGVEMPTAANTSVSSTNRPLRDVCIRRKASNRILPAKGIYHQRKNRGRYSKTRWGYKECVQYRNKTQGGPYSTPTQKKPKKEPERGQKTQSSSIVKTGKAG